MGNSIRNTFLLFLIFYSCERNCEYQVGLFSKWSWEKSTGGIGGTTYTPESTGDKKIIEFTPDYIYREYVNDTLKLECNFHFAKLEINRNHDSINIIVYDKRSISQSYLIKDLNTLILNDVINDGYEHQYKRR